MRESSQKITTALVYGPPSSEHLCDCSLNPDGGAFETGLINVGDEILSVDGIIPKEKLSDDAKEMYHFDDADTSYKSLNVRVSVYEQIRRIAKKDNRTINATVALMVKETLKNRRKQSV